MQEPNGGWTEALGNAANIAVGPDGVTGEIISALDREWLVTAVDGWVRAQFEQWLRKRARLAIKMTEQEDVDEADKMRGKFTADYAAGFYNWEGKYCREARLDAAGIVYMFTLLLKRGNKGVTEDIAERVIKDNQKGFGEIYAWALGNSSAPSQLRKMEATAGQNGTHQSMKNAPDAQAEPATLDQV
jgi:hypothetical protein